MFPLVNPVDPLDLMQAQVAGPQAAYAGVPVAPDASGTPTVPPYTSVTEKEKSESQSFKPETGKIVEAQEARDAANAEALAAAQRKKTNDIQEETFRAEQRDRELQIKADEAKERALLEQENNRRMGLAFQELEKRKEERRRMKPTTYIEDMSPIRQVLTALSLGMGAYASTRGDAPNTAYQIFANNEAAHRAKQQALIDKKQAEIEDATGNAAQAAEWGRQQRIALNDRTLGKLDYLTRQMEAKIARIPKAGAAGDAAIASAKQDTAKVNLEQANLLAGNKTVQGPEKSTTTVEGKKDPNACNRPPLNVIDSYLSAKNNERDMRAGGDALSNQKAFEEMRTAYRDQLRTEIQNRGGFKGITNFGQVLGAVELNLADRLKTPEARAAYKAMVPIIARQARKLDDKGALSDMTIEKAEESLGLASTTSKEMAGLAYQMADDYKNTHELIARVYPSLVEQAAGQPAPTQQPAPPPGPRPAPGGQTPAQKRYVADTQKQIEADKRDFAAERREIAQARALLKGKSLTVQEREALEWADKNTGQKARDIRRRILAQKGGE